jgi:hypothetical protein
MNCLDYFRDTVGPVCGSAIDYLDRPHPNSDDDDETLGTILAEMPVSSNCGDDCKLAVDHCAALCSDIRKAFGDDLPRLYENVVYATLRTLSCFIRG